MPPNIVHRGKTNKNLAQISRYLGKVTPARITILKRPRGKGFLEIMWKDGMISTADFASYSILTDWLWRKRTIKGQIIYGDNGVRLFTV